MKLQPAPIHFGTDGWRGVLGVDITVERLLNVAIAASQEMICRATDNLNQIIIIGFDRRFLAAEFAEAISAGVRACDVQPLLTDSPVTTPACSWAVVENNALGALVITASHNPPEWLGLKIKDPTGRSVEEDFTKAVENRLLAGGVTIPVKGIPTRLNCRSNHLAGLKQKINVPTLVKGLRDMGLKVIIDSMHGSAAGCMTTLLGEGAGDFVQEIRTKRDPLFGGNSPEPLEKNLHELISLIKNRSSKGECVIGLAFDGDGDRLAAIDETGQFCSTQSLIPLFIKHLAGVRNLPGCIVKTVSGSDCIYSIAAKFGREVIECPVGFKYIAHEMVHREVLLGGEESGGIGFGDHLPERDALYAALLLLESLVYSRTSLGVYIDQMQGLLGKSFYDRVDIRLSGNEARQKFEDSMKKNPPLFVLDQKVQEVIDLDGWKLRLEERHWLMFRCSGTEPLLRIYCEAPSVFKLENTLKWAKDFLLKI